MAVYVFSFSTLPGPKGTPYGADAVGFARDDFRSGLQAEVAPPLDFWMLGSWGVHPVAMQTTTIRTEPMAA